MEWSWLEIFKSFQGEGKYLGSQSVFVRLTGCNFTCSKLNCSSGESEDRLKIDASSVKSLSDLPLVTRGCDSYAAWDGRFKHLWKKGSGRELANNILNIARSNNNTRINIIFTGGEPLLTKWQKGYASLLDNIITVLGQSHIELGKVIFETNGTIGLTDDFKRFMEQPYINDRAVFSVSPKLVSSGEKYERSYKPKAVSSYLIDNSKVYLKFVVGSYEDVKEAISFRLKLLNNGVHVKEFFLMPLGGTKEVYDKHKSLVYDWSLEHNFSFSPRLHVEVKYNGWGC